MHTTLSYSDCNIGILLVQSPVLPHVYIQHGTGRDVDEIVPVAVCINGDQRKKGKVYQWSVDVQKTRLLSCSS